MPVISKYFHPYLLIIDRYLLREFVLNLITIVSGLWLIFIATRLARYLSQIAIGGISGKDLFTLIAYSSLGALSLLLPISAFLAVMLTLGRRRSNNELIIIATCGIYFRRIMKNVGFFSSTVALIIAILSLLIVPNILHERYKLERQSKITTDITSLVIGNFRSGSDGNWTIYSKNLSKNNKDMKDVFIKINDERQISIFKSAQGYFEIDIDTGNRYLILKDGFHYRGEIGKLNFHIAKYASHSILIEKSKQKRVFENHKTLRTMELWERGDNKDLAELQWRISLAIMTIILCLMAMSLTYSSHKKGLYGGFLPAILIYIIYNNLLGLTRAWVTKGVIIPWLGAIWVHVLMASILLVVIRRHKF